MIVKLCSAAAALAVFVAAAPAAAEPAPGFDCAIRAIPEETRAQFRRAYAETGIQSAAGVLLDDGLVERMSSCAPGRDGMGGAVLLGRVVMAHELRGAAQIVLTTRRGLDPAVLEQAYISMPAADRALIAAAANPEATPEARQGVRALLLRLFAAAAPGTDPERLSTEPGLFLDFLAYVGSRAYLESLEKR